jgi:hypothetical protein
MKKLFALLCFSLASSLLSAQTNSSKESVFVKMAAELCKEIKSKDSALRKSTQLDMDFGLIMIPIFSKYEDQLKTAIPGFELSEQSEMLGEEMGKRLATGCPEFLSIMTSSPEFMESVNKEDGPVIQKLEGTLINITAGDFSAIHVKTASGKTEKIWWMEYFPGEDKLSGGKLINKKLTIKYSEREVYNAGMKTYIKVKVAAGID